MKISIVIPAYNEETYIGTCLDSVLKHVDTAVHEVIVVDNNSVDNTASVVESKSGVMLVREQQPGTSNARQAGAEAASGDVITYLDADCTIDANWLGQIERLFADEKVVFLSGPYKYTDSKKYPNWLLNSMWVVFGTLAYWLTGYVGNGGNCVVRKNALEVIGGNDRSFAFYGDDTDLAKRLHKVGKTLWQNKFNSYTSARRFDEQGLRLYVTYFLNYWWTIFFKKPYTKGSQFLLTQQENKNSTS